MQSMNEATRDKARVGSGKENGVCRGDLCGVALSHLIGRKQIREGHLTDYSQLKSQSTATVHS